MNTEAQDRELFTKFFTLLAEERGAFTAPAKLDLARELLKQAEEDGRVPVELRDPVSLSKMLRVNINDPRVQAIRAGQEVALGDVTMGGEASLQSRMVAMSVPKKMALLVAALVVFIALFAVIVAVVRSVRASAQPTVTATVTIAPTMVFSPTFSPSPTSGQLPEGFVVVDAPENDPASGPNDPISVEFGGSAYVLNRGRVKSGEWKPVAGEWLAGTELRRVVAVPYSGEVGAAVQSLSFGAEIKLRLRSGEVVVYQLVSIVRAKTQQIELFSSLSPSLVILLHSERSGERYVLVAEAVQGCPDNGVCHTPTPTLVPGVPTNTPTLTPTPTNTPTPTSTSTPALTFVAPVQSSLVVTDSWSVVNTAAGLRLDVVSCSRVAQIGDKKGRFVVCDVTLTAEANGAAYSGQTLAIAEYEQVVNSADWWPEAVALAGALGDGRIGRVGDSVSGKVAGEVKKGSLTSPSDPVILWEQAGIRFLIYLEH